MKNKVFYFTAESPQLQRLLERQGAIVFNYTRKDESTEGWKKLAFDYALFPGGADVSPFLYGDKMITSPRIHPNFVRDMTENRLFRKMNILTPKIGVGRGAQFLNVMSGGRLYQHISGHIMPHSAMNMLDGKEYNVQSTHRQEMIPASDSDLVLVASVADMKVTGFTTEHLDQKKDSYQDVECLYNKRINSLMFQPRPEHGHAITEKLFFELFDHYFKEAA